jgi:hypothetical protein
MGHWKSGDEVEIVAMAPDLFRISARRGTSQRHAYFLRGGRDNVLFHGPDLVPFYRTHAKFFDEHGGIGLQALTHGGDASKACAHVREVWGAPVWVNEWEIAEARVETGIEIEKGFANGEPLAPNNGHVVKPMPTEGRWCQNAHTALVGPALDGLAQLRDLEVDFLCPDLTRWGVAPPLPFGPVERSAIVEDVRAYLERKHGPAASR